VQYICQAFRSDITISHWMRR